MLLRIIIQDRKCVAWDIGLQEEERSLPGGKTRFGFLEEVAFEPNFKGWEGFGSWEHQRKRSWWEPR